MSTILVTGGSGFIGAHVARCLAEAGYRVVIADLQPPAGVQAYILRPVSDQLVFERLNIEQWSEVISAIHQHRPEAIVHTAAIGDPAAVHQRPHLALRVNLVGSLNILESARLFGVRRTILFSSIGALPGVRYEPIDPDHPVICSSEGPSSGFYGASKLAVEAFAFGYQNAFGLDFAVFRPSAVYGLGMRHPIFIRPMVENAVDGVETVFSHGREFPRDYTHVSDVAQMVQAAVEVPQLTERVFYAATGERLHTAGEVAEIVQRLIPGAKIHIASGLSDSDRLEIRYRGRLSIGNVLRILNYRPRFRRLEDGIAEYIESYRRYRQENPK
jgi:nucleoside-diphosphate-sugar epimerase